MKQLFAIGEACHEIGLTRPGMRYRLFTERGAADVSLEPRRGEARRLEIDGQPADVLIAVEGDMVHVHLDGAAHTLRWIDPVTRFSASGATAAGDVATAPMPGTVVALLVEPGQAVAEGDALLVIESMKLETTIRAERAGRVETVHVGPGGTFDRGAALVSLASETTGG